MPIAQRTQPEYFAHLHKKVESWWPEERAEEIFMITGESGRAS